MLKRALMVLYTVAVVAVVIALLPQDAWARMGASLTAYGVAASFAVYLLTCLTMAWRWGWLFDQGEAQRLPFADLLAVSAAHNLYNQLLPARAGELTILFLARRYLRTGASVSASSLVLARAMDFLALAALGFIALPAAAAPGETRSALLTGTVALLVLPVLALVAFLVFGRRLAQVLAPKEPNPHARLPLLPRVRRLLADTALRLSERRSARFYLATGTLSLLLSATRMVVLGLLAWAAPHGGPDLLGAFTIGLCTMLVSVVPVSGAMNAGTFEAGWVLGAILVGLDGEAALVTAVAAHLAVVLFQAGLGALGQLWLTLRATQR